MSWIWFTLLNALALSAVAITQKRALREEHSLEFATLTTVFRLVFFYSIFWSKISWTISYNQLFGLICTAILAATAFWMVSKALRRQEMSIVFPIINLDAGLTAILAFFVLRESLDPKQILGLAVVVIGTYMLHLSQAAPESKNNWQTVIFPFRELWKRPGGRYAFYGMGAFAVNAILDRSLLQQIPWTTYLAYVLPIMMTYFLILSATRGHTFSTYRHSWKNILPWVLLASAFYLVSNIANSIAISMASIGLVIAVKRSSTLLDIIVSGKIFHERAIIQKALAASVMLIGLFLILT